jgi:exopolysaccharide biosynthesis polyprenyl glycosylphosphotransferase
LLKECGDRASAALGILAILPLLVAIALAVRLDSRGPVIFRQKRVGLNGEEFTMLKFRSMSADAESRLAEIAHLDEHGTGQLFKVKNDPRITRVGAFIRRYSLDELPQLFNVLRGEMSLVGPRPPLPREVEAYSPVAMPRLKVKPGLTGLWQVSGRSDLSVEESVRLDLRYVENWSLMMDAMILWKTARAVLGKSGAY